MRGKDESWATQVFQAVETTKRRGPETGEGSACLRNDEIGRTPRTTAVGRGCPKEIRERQKPDLDGFAHHCHVI